MSNNIGYTQKRGSNFRPPLEGYYSYLLIVLIGFFIADLIILSVRDSMLPQKAPPIISHAEKMIRPPNVSYSQIVSRNIFSFDGTIPDPLMTKDSSGPQREEAPVPSSLPLTLIGTLVHSNPQKSIAAIEVKSKNGVVAYSVGVDIERFATLVRVERMKAILRNLSSGRLEYIEIRDSNKLAVNLSKAPVAPVQATIKEIAQDKYEVSRADVNKATQNMQSLLMQASSIPRKKANGEIDGFTILNIQPGSLYTQLGLMNGDTIKKVNGEPVDSPAKALELYNALKNSSNVKITIERDGRDAEKDFSIK